MAILSIGSHGPDVVTLQQELNRQLYPSPRLSVDGAFGRLTREAVRAFQKDAGLKVDGLVGPMTRAALGMADSKKPFTHRVRLHFRSISLTEVPFNTILAHTQSVYAPYGIKIEFASGMSLGLPEDQLAELTRIDSACVWDVTSGDAADLLKLGVGIGPTDIAVFYVDSFADGDLGCGGHLKNKPACIVARTGSKWDTAHEVGHVLLGSGFSPVHVDDINNLMHPTASAYAKTPVFTDAQLQRIRASNLCVAI